jgi:hypothetical protein
MADTSKNKARAQDLVNSLNDAIKRPFGNDLSRDLTHDDVQSIERSVNQVITEYRDRASGSMTGSGTSR